MIYKFIYSRILKIDFIFNFNENPSSGLGTYMNIFPFRKEWECWNALISTLYINLDLVLILFCHVIKH